MLLDGQSSVRVAFPDAKDQLSLLEVTTVMSQVNDLYELTALWSIPDDTYARQSLGSSGPRRNSRLEAVDQLHIASIQYGSDLQFVMTSLAGLGFTGMATFIASQLPGIFHGLESCQETVYRMRDRWREDSELRRLAAQRRDYLDETGRTKDPATLDMTVVDKINEHRRRSLMHRAIEEVTPEELADVLYRRAEAIRRTAGQPDIDTDGDPLSGR